MHPPTARRIRTDISATLFLTPPDDYDGGELTIDDTYGTQAVKLPAGDLVIYPGDQRASRDAGDARRARRRRSSGSRAWCATTRSAACCSTWTWRSCASPRDVTEHPSLVTLTGCYHNLLRRWADA